MAITSGIGTVEPLLTLGFASSASSNNIIHELVDKRVAVTFFESDLRTGTLQFLFQTEADAAEAETMLRTGSVFLFDDTDRPSLDMTFIVNGNVGRTLDDETRELWVVSVDFQEVAA